MVLYSALREERNQQILWALQKFKYTRESSLAKFSIHLHGLQDSICIIRSCSGAQSQVEQTAWALLCAVASVQSKPFAPFSQTHSTSGPEDTTVSRSQSQTWLVWTGSHLPKGLNSNHITVVQLKVCTFCPETHEKTPGFKDKLIQLKIQVNTLIFHFSRL